MATKKKELLEQIEDRFGDNIYITNVTDTTFDVTVNAVVSAGLVTWIMNYGDLIKVLKPEELQNKITDRAIKIIKNYAKT